MSDAGPSALLDLEAAIAADLERRRPQAMAAWVRLFLDLPTKELQAEYIGRITRHHGEGVAREVVVIAVERRHEQLVGSGSTPAQTQAYIARVERELGRAIADQVRDRLAERMWRGTNNNGGIEDA